MLWDDIVTSPIAEPDLALDVAPLALLEVPLGGANEARMNDFLTGPAFEAAHGIGTAAGAILTFSPAEGVIVYLEQKPPSRG